MIRIHINLEMLLKQMSQLLKNYVPKQFQIFRNGGEEFSVVIRNYSLDQSVKLVKIFEQVLKSLHSTYQIRKS